MSSEALYRCEEQKLNFAEVFRYQYLITESELGDFPMECRRLGGWHVHTGSHLPVARIRDEKGKDLALFLGIGVDQGGLIEVSHTLKGTDAADLVSFQVIEKWLKHVAGRYTLIAHAGGQARVYGDPVGMNGIVYDAASRRVAASTLLCLVRPLIQHPLYDHEIVEKEGGKYSLFHTRDAHVRRLNPNAYLDLANFGEHRFWPCGETFQSSASEWPALYDEMAETTKHVVRSIARSHTTALPISGGQDSRLLAAMIGPEIHQIGQVFTNIHNYASRIDAAIANRIAQRLGVEHQVFDKRKVRIRKWRAQKAEQEYRIATGIMGAAPKEIRHGLHLQLADGAVVLRGHQTDLLRAVFLTRPHPDQRTNFRWQIKRLLIVPRQRFSNRIYRRFLPFYEQWYDTLPPEAREKPIDFMFLEIYYSSTVGVTFPALNRNFFMSPFNSRRMIELALSLDDMYRRSSFPVHDILWRQNRALHDLPLDYEFLQVKAPLDELETNAILGNLIAQRREATRNRAEGFMAGGRKMRA